MGTKSAIRRLAIVGAVAGFASLPQVAHAAPSFTSVAAHCSVDRATVLTTANSCPIKSTSLLGDASAVGTFDANTGGFVVDTRVRRHGRIPIVIGHRNAMAMVRLTKTATSATGGPIQVVFDQLSGTTTGPCVDCVVPNGQAGGSTALEVDLYFHSPEGTATHTAFCPASFGGDPTPTRFVFPDDCPYEVTLSVPPNSTFDITVVVIALANATGATNGRASLAGRVAEIRIP